MEIEKPDGCEWWYYPFIHIKYLLVYARRNLDIKTCP